MPPVQLSLLEPPAAEVCAPAGFAYRRELISRREEAALIAHFAELPFREFEFHGFFGKRRTVSYGLRYDFADSELHEAEDFPDFLLPLRGRAAEFAGVAPARIAHALVTEYAPGAAIGWHRDRPVYDEIIGVSFASPCRFRFRRRGPAAAFPSSAPSAAMGRASGGRAASWQRLAVTLEPRSAYILRGAARGEWEHSIPAAEALRYSVTFRTLKETAA